MNYFVKSHDYKYDVLDRQSGQYVVVAIPRYIWFSTLEGARSYIKDRPDGDYTIHYTDDLKQLKVSKQTKTELTITKKE